MTKAALKETIARGHWPAVLDMRVRDVHEARPDACERFRQAAGGRPVLCGQYPDRTLADVALIEHIPLEDLLKVLSD
jgi:hypothetical protein